MSDLTDDQLAVLAEGWRERWTNGDLANPSLLSALDELVRRRAEQSAGREHVERVVREEFVGRFCTVFSQPGIASIGESFARRVADRLSVPVLSDRDAGMISSIRRYIASTTGLSAFPDQRDAAESHPIPLAWVALLDRFIATGKP